jgi:hypothetical protein
MRRTARNVAALVALVVVAACSSQSSNATSPYCPDLATDAVLPAPLSGTGGWTVTYSFTFTSGAVVDSVQYRDAGGVLLTESGPVPPWSRGPFTMAAGDRVTLVLQAYPGPGSVVATTRAENSTGSSHEVLEWKDSCGP